MGIIQTAYVRNSQFLPCPVQVPIDCSKVNITEDGYFILTNNTFDDGCGGYRPVGEKIPENMTAGFEAGVDYIYLIHVVGNGTDVWISGTREDFAATCKCSNLYVGRDNIIAASSDETTALTTGTAKITFRIPYDFALTRIKASLTTAQSAGNILTVDVNRNGTSILATKITIDNGEKTSKTAAIQPVLASNFLADDDEMTVDIDQIGTSGATGLKVELIHD